MIKIIVCDDDPFTLRIVCEHLKKAICLSQTHAQICCVTTSGNELLNYIQNTSDSYLYFLDFDFGEYHLNGIDLVKSIYQRDKNAKIVFVTSHSDKSVDILKSGICAFGFIEKVPQQNDMVAEYIKCLKMAETSNPSSSHTAPMLKLPIGIDEFVELSAEEIVYVDSVKTIAHAICYHTFNGSQITLRDTIEHAQKLLGKDFIRCHRSVLVNRYSIVSLKNGLLKLSNGETVNCAISKRKEIAALCFSKENRKNYD